MIWTLNHIAQQLNSDYPHIKLLPHLKPERVTPRLSSLVNNYMRHYTHIWLEEVPVLQRYMTACNCGHPSHPTVLMDVYNLDWTIARKCCPSCRTNFVYVDGKYWVSRPEPAIYHYHGGPRHRIDDYDRGDDSLVGIELETFIETPETTARKVASIAPIVPERDCSLDGEYGIEFVFKPLGFKTLSNSPFVPALQCMHEVSKTWEKNGYGNHISINAGEMESLHVSKFCHFINCNEEFCLKIAGRASHYARFGRGIETSRYGAASHRSDTRVEVRMFKSSTKWERLHRNCAFVDSARVFTRENRIDACTPENYLTFIADKPDYESVHDFYQQYRLKPYAEIPE